MTRLRAALVQISTLLDELSIPYMLIGGLAVAVWQEPRATLDVDVNLWVEPDELEPAIQVISQRFRPWPADPLDFVAKTRILPVFTPEGIKIDLVFAQLQAERELIDRAVSKRVGDKTIRVAALEDLIWMKLMSEREKDVLDARNLIHRYRKTLDRAYVEPRLRELSEAFARPEILTTFQEEMK